MEEEIKRKVGRPTEYTKEMADKICELVAIEGKGLKRICAQNPCLPDKKTIMRWILRHEEFGLQYHKAKIYQIETIIDDVLEIADDTSHDNLIRYDKDGEPYEVCNSEWINRSRLRVETRKWLASKLVPKLYGDKVQSTNDLNVSILERAMDKL